MDEWNKQNGYTVLFVRTKLVIDLEWIMQVILVAIVTVIATLLIFKRKVPELY